MKIEDSVPHPSQWLSADRPIETCSEDALGRKSFSEALASAVREWSGRESLILALYGPWGNGKSSIKNMVVECLNQCSPTVRSVDFNPWQMANRPSLSEAFFDELGVALGKGDVGSNSVKRSLLNKYRRWALRLQGGRNLAKATSNLIGSLLIFFGVLALSSTWIFTRTASVVLGSITLLAGLAAFTTKIVEATIKFLEAGTEVGTKSINEVKEELARDLRRLKAPILIAIDDLDRLTPAEILEVFQLIKANGDFPNVIYLLLCDRDIVESHIGEILKVSGREYLEKIVQVAFDVPLIDIKQVHQVLFGRLDAILSGDDISAHFDGKRWANIFRSGLHSYFETLRDVNRFISTFAFHISTFSADSAFEVNVVDLIALETIRIAEPKVYRALRSSKDILTTGRPDRYGVDFTKQALNSIVELGSEERRKELTSIIKHLFPTAEWAFDGPNYAQDYAQTWYLDLRICSVKLFDRYFRFSVSDQELSQTVVQQLTRARGDRDQLRAELELLASKGMLDIAFEELAVRSDEIESAQVKPFITAILDIGDLLPESKRGMFELPTSWRVAFLIENSIKKLDGVENRSSALVSAIEDTVSIGIALEVTADLCDKPEKAGEEAVFPEAEAVKARNAAVLKLENAAEAGTLLRSPKLALLLHFWQKWGRPTEVASYVVSILASQEGTVQLLKSFVVRSYRQQIGDYVGTERLYMRRNDIEPVVSMDAINERIQTFEVDGIDDEGRRAIECFQKAMARRNTGKPDDGPFVED